MIAQQDPDRVNRRFKAARPNKLWVSDFSSTSRPVLNAL